MNQPQGGLNRSQEGPGRIYLLLMPDRLENPTTHSFRRRHLEGAIESPTGARTARPAAPSLSAVGRAASDTLLHEVESLMAAERTMHLLRQRSAAHARRRS